MRPLCRQRDVRASLRCGADAPQGRAVSTSTVDHGPAAVRGGDGLCPQHRLPGPLRHVPPGRSGSPASVVSMRSRQSVHQSVPRTSAARSSTDHSGRRCTPGQRLISPVRPTAAYREASTGTAHDDRADPPPRRRRHLPGDQRRACPAMRLARDQACVVVGDHAIAVLAAASRQAPDRLTRPAVFWLRTARRARRTSSARPALAAPGRCPAPPGRRHRVAALDPGALLNPRFRLTSTTA